MARKRFTPEQIITMLREAGASHLAPFSLGIRDKMAIFPRSYIRLDYAAMEKLLKPHIGYPLNHVSQEGVLGSRLARARANDDNPLQKFSVFIH